VRADEILTAFLALEAALRKIVLTAFRPASFAIRAQQRMGYGRCDIQVLDENWNVVQTITNEDVKPVV
jgi:hypothetical protein